MLILTRKSDESIIIGNNIKIKVLKVQGNQVHIGIDAPRELSVYREEIYEQILGPNWKDQVITVRPADLIEPMFEKCRDELAEKGLSTREEDVMSYAIYPMPAEKFLRGEAKPEAGKSGQAEKMSFNPTHAMDCQGHIHNLQT